MKVDNGTSSAVSQPKAPETKPAAAVETKTAETKPAAQPDAGKTSKLGELNNKADQIKGNIAAAEKEAAKSKFSKEATVTKTGDKITVQTNATDDKIGVTQDPKTGDITIKVNGESQTFSGKEKDNITIKAGDGNDTITVDKNVTVKITIDGEKGNDNISVDKDSKTGHAIDGGDGDDKLNGGGGNDTIKGGAGNDTIEAGAGDDNVDGGDGRDYINGSKGNDTLSGGAGDDVIYGGDGNDTIKGNDGNDYLEGSAGNDDIEGGKGKDILSGGLGDDNLKGGEDDDVLYAGKGKDTVAGEQGNNKVFAEKDDTVEKNAKGVTNTVVTLDLSKAVGNNIVINGSDEFKERVEADLEMLRSSQVGRDMFTSFDDTKKTVTINQTSEGNSATWPDRGTPGKPQPWYDDAAKKNGDAVNAISNYNPQRVTVGGNDRPPVVGLFHEMAHNWDYTHGTLRKGDYSGKDATDSGVTIRERAGVGLPIDHDNDPKTAEIIDPIHPYKYTENALRDELNIKKRDHYNY